LQREKRPLIVYVHPREIDPGHQRLPLGWWRSFKCYNNLATTFPKLQWLCEHHRFGTMADLAAQISPTCKIAAPDHEAAALQPATAGSSR
jgi:hypothetical protein